MGVDNDGALVLDSESSSDEEVITSFKGMKKNNEKNVKLDDIGSGGE